MPNIHTYEQPQLGIQANEVGPEAFAQAGRRIGAAYSDMAEDLRRTGAETASVIDTAGQAYDEYETHREIMTGGALAATMFANISNQWNATSKGADPNNPATAKQFREEAMEPALTDFAGQFTTQRAQDWAIKQTDMIREHMTHKMIADQSSAAADAVQVNIKQTANSLSNLARNDPTSVDAALATIDHTYGHMVDSSPAITPDVAARLKTEGAQELKEQVVKAAVWGLAERTNGNADAIKNFVTNPKYSPYISGQEVTQAEGYAKMQRSASMTDQMRADELRDKAARDASTAQANDILTKIGSNDPRVQGSVTAKSILEDPKLLPAEKLTLNRFVAAENKPESEAAASSRSYNALLGRMYAPWGDPDKITSIPQLLHFKPDLTKADFNDLYKKLQDSQSTDGQKLTPMIAGFLKAYKGSINTVGGMKINNDDGEYRFNQWTHDQVAKSIADNKDPSELFQPGNPRFMGQPQVLSMFQKTLTQSMSDQARAISGGGATPAMRTPTLPDGAPKDAQMMQDKAGRFHAYIWTQQPDIKSGKVVGKWQIWDSSGLLDRGQ